MADKSFDVVIIGGGTKALSLGMYLQRYGGLQVGIFERRHEMGGGMCSEESPAPGFIADHHATDIADWYWEVALKDFPELKDRGLEWVPYIYPMGGVFVEDNDSWILQGPYQDPTGEKTAKDWERFSPRDAETFLKVWKGWREIIRPALIKAMHTVAPPPHEPDEMEKAAPRFVKEIGLEEPFCYIQNP
ncbi:MAG: NAD(P)-binding protein, partial [Syntrophales bacterium]|nr:NAD(P)-binding protein [Syntrophales bacterium]